MDHFPTPSFSLSNKKLLRFADFIVFLDEHICCQYNIVPHD